MKYNWQVILNNKTSVTIIAINAAEALKKYGDCSQVVELRRISEVRETI